MPAPEYLPNVRFIEGGKALMQFTAAVPVGVVGSGTMGAGIAQIAAQAGHPVLLLDSVPGRARSAVDAVGKQWDRMVGKGRLDGSAAAVARANLKAATDLAD